MSSVSRLAIKNNHSVLRGSLEVLALARRCGHIRRPLRPLLHPAAGGSSRAPSKPKGRVAGVISTAGDVPPDASSPRSGLAAHRRA